MLVQLSLYNFEKQSERLSRKTTPNGLHQTFNERRSSEKLDDLDDDGDGSKSNNNNDNCDGDDDDN